MPTKKKNAKVTNQNVPPMTVPALFATTDGDAMVLASFRYCLQRHTYFVSCCVDYLTKFWDYISPITQEVILKEIALEYAQPKPYNPHNDMDLGLWSTLFVSKFNELPIESQRSIYNRVTKHGDWLMPIAPAVDKIPEKKRPCCFVCRKVDDHWRTEFHLSTPNMRMTGSDFMYVCNIPQTNASKKAPKNALRRWVVLSESEINGLLYSVCLTKESAEYIQRQQAFFGKTTIYPVVIPIPNKKK